MKTRDKVECIVFRRIDNTQEFLLLKCVSERGGIWQPITGSVEDFDATIEEAAYRELLEETGISRDQVIYAIPNVHFFEMTKHHKTGEPIPAIREYVFGFEVGASTRVVINKNTSQEHEEFLWTSMENALQLLKWENNKEAFRKLHKHLAAKQSEKK